MRCFDVDASEAMIAEIKAAAKDGDSLGGIVEVLAFGVPVGLGSHVHWDRKIDAAMAQALMSIQAVKGVEIGDGFDVAGRRGSAAHDPITWDSDARQYRRTSTLAGGTEGGMTTGELVVARAAMKPLATLNKPTLGTVDTETKEPGVSFKERTDVTAVPAMGVVAETMVALVLAIEAQRKFGGDSMEEFVRNAAVIPRLVDMSELTCEARHLVLVGMMGTGKSTVGRVIARRLRRPLLDSDELIEARTGRTVREIWASEGEGDVPCARDRNADRHTRIDRTGGHRRGGWCRPVRDQPGRPVRGRRTRRLAPGQRRRAGRSCSQRSPSTAARRRPRGGAATDVRRT